jgi:hypothetical protein
VEYKSYMHIERLGTEEVDGIDIGECFIFPKCDGTNASIWIDENNIIQCGSRTRWLANGQNDNANFRHAVNNEVKFEGLKKCLQENPNLRFFGEWLVQHTLKTYRQNAWKKLYIFDVTKEIDGLEKYLHYDEYKLICDKYGIDYIPCIAIIKNPTMEDFLKVQERNNYLIEDGKGLGEGIVIKNYFYYNKYGRQTWAKLVTSEFKEKHYKEMGAPEKENKMIEELIAETFCTLTLIDKTYAKIFSDKDGWSTQYIPRLLETVYHDMVVEEIYTILKNNNFPKIDFKTLRIFVIKKIKQLKPELF